MKMLVKSGSLLTLLAATALYAAPASADTVSRSVTTTPDGAVVHSKTVTNDDANISTITTRTTKTDAAAPAPMPVASTTTSTTTTTSPIVTTTEPAAGGTDLSTRRVGGTYKIKGDDTLRYENRTFDNYNN